MFNCLACSQSPFAAIFGTSEEEPPRKKKKKVKKIKKSEKIKDFSNNISRSSFSSYLNEIRNKEEISLLVENWEMYVHPRAKEFWKKKEKIKQTLALIAEGISRADDPILGEDSKCVIWKGNYCEEEYLPIVLVIPSDEEDNENEEPSSYTSVTRLLVFLYADEESFLELQGKKQKAFRMVCKNSKCVNLTHICLDD